MDKAPFRTRSAQFPHNRTREVGTSASKKNLLTSFKNYVISKFRSDKYDVNGNSSRDISILSYDRHNFQEAERKYDLIPSGSLLTADERLTRAIRTVLSQISSEELARMSQERIELLQIIERTFNRQLDIFEGLVQINIETRRTNKKLPMKQLKAIDDRMSDMFMDNLVEKVKIAVESSPEVSQLLEQGEEIVENEPGDNPEIKVVNINCECQNVKADGAAIPSIPSIEG